MWPLSGSITPTRSIVAAIARGCLAPALEHPAVDQKADFRRFYQHARARDFAGCAKEAQLHRRQP